MLVRRLSDNRSLTLDPGATLGSGGEATIYRILDKPGLAAKIYHQFTEDRIRKLVVMRENPPDDPTRILGHTSLTWPGDLLSDPATGRVLGYLMPRVEGMRPVFTYYNPLSRRQNSPLFDYRYLHVAAGNLASAVAALHRGGYVIGDVNESNILVSDTALATLVDTDSFQVKDAKSGATYRCTVGKPDFTPPELQGVHFSEVDRSLEHDRFGLGCLLFRMLMEGTHPFDGIYQGEGDPPSQGERISAGHFPYGANSVPYRPKPGAPPFELLPAPLQELFRLCFEAGHREPGLRPDAETWLHALNAAEKALISCKANERHLYGDHLTACPWCARTTLLGGLDPFPSVDTVRKGQHLRPITPVRTPILATRSPSAVVPHRMARRSRKNALGMAAVAIPSRSGKRARGSRARTVRRWVLVSLALFIGSGVIPLTRRFFANLNPGAPISAPPPPTPDSPAPPGESPFVTPSAILTPLHPPPGDPARIGQTSPNAKDGAVMVWIPAGGFRMGSDGADNERPRHLVSLPGYWIYKTPVTVAQYRKFCKETGREMPYAPFWDWQEDHPMVNVSWYDAKAYCDWAGVLLPTEAQWEKAASGSQNWKYPWGDFWDPARCRNAVGKPGAGAAPVGAFPGGASLYGVQDMAGNALQWCADWYQEDYYARAPRYNPIGPLSGGRRALRGGSWSSEDPALLCTTARYGYNPYTPHDFIGFRCASW